ncbi:MAG TPA: hypothetical protein DEF45_20295 [Rhodopirellula sp.]|nr:MAG: hypothetical protein CBD74_05720 [Saprospirales bacterium TMED214]HBV65353.1 hypothetical protein [Rhodopirellula sp.]
MELVTRLFRVQIVIWSLDNDFFWEDCTKSPISGNSLLTIFSVLAYFFGRFRNFGTVVGGRTGKTRVPEATGRLPWQESARKVPFKRVYRSIHVSPEQRPA